jgi:cell division protein FtsZ
MFELVNMHRAGAVIKVVGVGGGGSNAVQHMLSANIEGVEFVCANTDAQALGGVSARTVIQLGNM